MYVKICWFKSLSICFVQKRNRWKNVTYETGFIHKICSINLIHYFNFFVTLVSSQIYISTFIFYRCLTFFQLSHTPTNTSTTKKKVNIGSSEITHWIEHTKTCCCETMGFLSLFNIQTIYKMRTAPHYQSLLTQCKI